MHNLPSPTCELRFPPRCGKIYHAEVVGPRPGERERWPVGAAGAQLPYKQKVTSSNLVPATMNPLVVGLFLKEQANFCLPMALLRYPSFAQYHAELHIVRCLPRKAGSAIRLICINVHGLLPPRLPE